MLSTEQALRDKVQNLRTAYLDAGSGEREFAYLNGRKTPSAEISQALNEAIISLRGVSEKKASLEKVLPQRKANLSKAKAALHSAVVRSHELAVQIDSRRVDLECVKMAQEPLAGSITSSTSLGEAEKLLSQVDARIRVMARLSEPESLTLGEIAGAPSEGLDLISLADEALGIEPKQVSFDH